MSSNKNKYIPSNEKVFDNLYNFENEEARRDKLDEAAKAMHSPDDTYFNEEKIPDEDAEERMIRNADEAIRRKREKQSESDPFEYAPTLIKLHEDASASEKEDILNKISSFTEGYKKILEDESINIDQQEIEAKKLFDKTFGKLIYGYKPETNTHTLGAHKPGYVKVSEKKATGTRIEYDDKGQPIDPDAPVKKSDKRAKADKHPKLHSLIGDFKLPFRNKNRK